MENLRIRFRTRVGDHIDRGGVPLICQVPAIDKDREPVAPSISRAETEQYITIGKQRVRLINWITREDTLQVWARIEANRAFVKQLRFINVNRNSREAIVTLKATVFSPPAFVMTNLYFPPLSGVSFSEHFGPGESSFPTCLPAWS